MFSKQRWSLVARVGCGPQTSSMREGVGVRFEGMCAPDMKVNQSDLCRTSFGNPETGGWVSLYPEVCETPPVLLLCNGLDSYFV